jgi:hypothetical protein
MTTDIDLLAGRLCLAPGTATPVTCERPMVGAALLRRLTEGRRAALLPDLVGSIFTLCAAAQRMTARRAVAAALGLPPAGEAARGAERRQLAMATAREHLQRLALDLPNGLPQAGQAVDPGWLRDAPLLGVAAKDMLPARVQQAAASLPGWLERRLFGVPPLDWLQRWRQGGTAWLAEWSQSREHPLARWLTAARPLAEATAWACRPLAVLDEGEAGLSAVAAAVRDDDEFPLRPTWHGLPAETGPWSRHARGDATLGEMSAWHRLGARLADLAALAAGEGLEAGALAVAPGEGLAWTEMSRGLLMHWVQLEDARAAPDTARVARFRVLAPTEWNFHPDGSLARALAGGRFDARATRLAALALDPCLRFDLVEAAHA